MSNEKQYVIIRRDLGLTDGALAAQVAHLSLLSFLDNLADTKEITNTQQKWIKSPYLILLGVDNNDELEMVIDKCESAGLANEYSTWCDTIYSKTFDSWYKARIGIVIGPEDSDLLKTIVGNLDLY